MVLAYHCEGCGIQRNCDVDDVGERICPECEAWVSGITGYMRRHPSDGQAVGPIRWAVKTGYGSSGRERIVEASDVQGALGRAHEQADDPITRIVPRDRSLRK